MHDRSVKTELLSEFDSEWAHIELICHSLKEADMLVPVTGDWSVKDIICHLSAWEKYLLDRLGFVLTGQPPYYPVMRNWDDVHHFNAKVFVENKDRPLNSAIIEFRSLYQGVRAVLEALEDEQLKQPYTYDFPDDHITLLQLIRANLYEHYREHCLPLEKRTKPVEPGI